MAPMHEEISAGSLIYFKSANSTISTHAPQLLHPCVKLGAGSLSRAASKPESLRQARFGALVEDNGGVVVRDAETYGLVD